MWHVNYCIKSNHLSSFELSHLIILKISMWHVPKLLLIIIWSSSQEIHQKTMPFIGLLHRCYIPQMGEGRDAQSGYEDALSHEISTCRPPLVFLLEENERGAFLWERAPWKEKFAKVHDETTLMEEVENSPTKLFYHIVFLSIVNADQHSELKRKLTFG